MVTQIKEGESTLETQKKRFLAMDNAEQSVKKQPRHCGAATSKDACFRKIGRTRGCAEGGRMSSEGRRKFLPLIRDSGLKDFKRRKKRRLGGTIQRGAVT